MSEPATTKQLIEQGLFHHRQADLKTAMERYTEVLRIDPRNVDALYYIALVACHEGQFKQGLELGRRALEVGPPQARVHNLIGKAHDRLGDSLEAAKSYDAALKLDPDFAEAHGNRANLLAAAGMNKEALAEFSRAIALDPKSVPDLVNRGAVLEQMGRTEEALKDYDAAIALDENLSAAHANRANTLKDLGLMDLGRGRSTTPHFDAAIASYDQAIKLDPQMHEAHAARGHIKLMLGDWPAGFADYEHRAALDKPIFQALSDPRWDGAPLGGERLVLVAEQGLGDIIQFSRFAPMLAAQGHDVTLLVRKTMAPLLSTLKGVTVVTDESALKQDKRPLHWLPLLSVPGVLGVTPDTLPRDVPYLSAEPARVQSWGERLGGGGFKIGINWAPGHADRTQTSRRDIPLSLFAGLADLPGVELISLQKGAPTDQIARAAFRDKIKIIEADLNPNADLFLDTAAVMAHLDLVIGCDTAIVHLAGALARPVFTVVPVISDWRWMVSRDDTPWYPTMRLFRQDASLQWSPVLARVVAAVRARMAGAPSRHPASQN
jgi:tetratricopeptide (TPR) repeat protein/ADP-heptose:LPS heptosyltransferase